MDQMPVSELLPNGEPGSSPDAASSGGSEWRSTSRRRFGLAYQHLAAVGKAFLEVASAVAEHTPTQVTRGSGMHLKVFATAVMQRCETCSPSKGLTNQVAGSQGLKRGPMALLWMSQWLRYIVVGSDVRVESV